MFRQKAQIQFTRTGGQRTVTLYRLLGGPKAIAQHIKRREQHNHRQHQKQRRQNPVPLFSFPLHKTASPSSDCIRYSTATSTIMPVNSRIAATDSRE